ncbi:hypothetical protein K6119_10805 [Paracrocinitomix mangrovi]|uniref:hypothetical protein n=1 Tax=Paracrocinitomix mangrovi TaxID=2862509 RepID=UPI001C8D65B2|nr:hypothetical protein [Paracrocinitomix mangrovi]UKN00222.1 hypothetical protein K6119_10805 [Paracrocinitomix mangrovi]
MKIYLVLVLSIVLSSCQMEVGMSEESESTEVVENESNSIEPEIVNINLQANNVILWNEIQIDTSDLHDSISTLIIRSMSNGSRQLELDSIGTVNKTNYLIYLYTEKMTSYDFNTRFKEVVRNSIDLIREEKSQLFYQKSFTDLSTERQLNIKKVVEQCTIEKVSPE